MDGTVAVEPVAAVDGAPSVDSMTHTDDDIVDGTVSVEPVAAVDGAAGV